MPFESAWMNACWAASTACGGSPAASFADPRLSTIRSRCAAVTPDPASSWASWLLARCWKSAPIAVTPKVAPSMRLIDRIPDPTPDFAGVTAFIAAVDIGDITSAMPAPITMNAGSSRP
jgi:hypothetical protein